MDTRAIIYASEPLVIKRFNGNVFHNILLPIEEKEILGMAQIYKHSDGQFYIICEGLNETVKLYLFNPRSTEFIEVPIDWSQAIARNASNIYFYKGEEYLLIERDRTISVNKLKPTQSIEELFTFTSNENKFKVDNKSVLMFYEDFLIISDDNFPITFLDWQGTILHRYASDTFLRIRDIMTKKIWIENSISSSTISHNCMKSIQKIIVLFQARFPTPHLRPQLC